MQVTYGWPSGSDRRWRKLRAQKLEHEPRCESCLTKGKLSQATTVHHRRPISQGGAKYDPANLQSVCAYCHTLAHGGRSGSDVRGLPTDPNHPWNR
jgi:5-methylcytosine-specific restriction endonuclease McrA